MVKIKTSLVHRVNLTLNTSAGEITFNEKLVAEVEESVAEQLIELDDSISYVEEKKPVVIVPDASKVNDKQKNSEDAPNSPIIKEGEGGGLEGGEGGSTGEGQTTTLSPEEIKSQERGIAINQLTLKTIPDLQEMATKAGLPEAEWKTLKKAELVMYLVDK